MHVLAFMIIGFSSSIAALLSENVDEIALDSLPLLDRPFFDSSVSKPTIPDNEPSSFNFNLDNVVPLQTSDTPESIAFSPYMGQESSANIVNQPSIIDSSSAYTEAQIYRADSNEICYPHSSIGQKRKKRQSCINLSQFLFAPIIPIRNEVEETEEQEWRRKISNDDEEWMRVKFPEGMSEEEKAAQLDKLGGPGDEACEKAGKVYPVPVGCLGPEFFVHVPTLNLLPYEVDIKNVYNCVLFLLGRPFCRFTNYCCRTLLSPGPNVEWKWGYRGIECLEMPQLIGAPL